MARYTCSVTVAVALANLYPNLTDLLKSCNLEVLIFREDYLMAREKPGQVPFTKLATVEVLVDSTRSTMHAADFELVVKNEELPLQSNNHCSQVYQSLLKKTADNPSWRLLSCSDQDFAVEAPASDPQPAPPPTTPSDSATVAPSAPAGNSAAAASAPPSTPLGPVAEPAAAFMQESQEQLTPDPSGRQAPIPDSSRFTSLPHVTSRPPQTPAGETAATSGPSPSANGAKLTWKPLSSATPQAGVPKRVDTSASFEEFLAAGRPAESKTQLDNGSST